MTFRAVVFDLGGVVMESPLHAISRFEAAHEVPPGTITRLVGEAGEESAWTALETGRLSMSEFIATFESELSEAGVDVPVADMMRAIEAETVPRPAMLHAIDTLRAHGFTVAALTNNWVPFAGIDDHEVRPHFDVFVESYREGVNKPNPQIYQTLMNRLGVPPSEVVYLDDIGRNLKPARDMGMITIKVVDPAEALSELERVLGLDLV